MAVETSDQHRRSADPYAASAPEDKYRDDPGYGWVMFAGVLLLMIGTLSLILGIAAVGNSHFIASHPRYIIGTQHGWGRVSEILGIVALIVGCGVFVKNQLSRWVGVVVLAASAVAELLLMPSYPFWSLSIFALCVLAIYGLVVYGEKISSLKP